MIGHPLFCLGVDTFTVQDTGPLSEIMKHPLGFAGHVHYLTHHVREQGTLRLEEAIRKMTSMPAAHFGLWDRGLLRAGYSADVVVLRLRRARRRLDDARIPPCTHAGSSTSSSTASSSSTAPSTRARGPAVTCCAGESTRSTSAPTLHAPPTDEMWEAMRAAKLGWATSARIRPSTSCRSGWPACSARRRRSGCPPAGWPTWSRC